MTILPSTIQGDTAQEAGWGFPLQIAIPQLASLPSYTDLPPYWTWYRDVVLANTIHKEDMWSSAVGRTATKFAAHGYIVRDASDSQRRVASSLELLRRANGGEGWTVFAQKIIQDLLTTDNGVFIRIRRANDQAVRVRVKGTSDDDGFVELVQSSSGARITGLYHLDSLRCMRTGNLAYPVRYQPLMGPSQLLRWDQVLFYSDMTSPRAELYGVGLCAASRAYKTISKLAALEQLIHEFITGGGANKLAFVGGVADSTLRNLIAAGQADAQAKGFTYYQGVILGAIPGDTPVTINEIMLKSLPEGFDAKTERDNAYLIYANAIGVPVQDIQPLSGQGLGTGTQSVILQEASRGVGIAAFLKWWEQTVSDRVLPATTELQFSNEYDLRDQEQQAKVRALRAQERSTRINSGEISPAIARQLAADSDDLPQSLIADDITPGGQLRDDEKPLSEAEQNPEAEILAATAPNEPIAGPRGGQLKEYVGLWEAELKSAQQLAAWSATDE